MAHRLVFCLDFYQYSLVRLGVEPIFGIDPNITGVICDHKK
jgi:hypothetical protein